ncbi:hypothetical protein INR49_026965, partial [Caranx melampygus]
MFQLAHLYELLEDPQQAIEWLMQVLSVTPTDPQVLAKLGELQDSEGDKSQAFQYYYESFRYFPSNIDVIEWLGAYYIETQFCEKAIQYFERATLIQPTQVKWQLMVASCYRRSGNYQKALETYKDIHRKFPENVECLRFLVRLCTDMGLKEVQDYATKLKKVEKMKEIREQRVKSGREGSARGRRDGREGSAGSGGGSTTPVLTPPKKTSGTGTPLSVSLIPDLEPSVSMATWQPDVGCCCCCCGCLQSHLSGCRRSLERKHTQRAAAAAAAAAAQRLLAEGRSTGLNQVHYASYVDPLGPQVERPKTGAKKRLEDDDFADEELGDDLLPEIQQQQEQELPSWRLGSPLHSWSLEVCDFSLTLDVGSHCSRARVNASIGFPRTRKTSPRGLFPAAAAAAGVTLLCPPGESSLLERVLRTAMARRIRVPVLLFLHLVLSVLVQPAEASRIRKKATRTRSCLDLPEEILEQMFGRLSVGVMSAFHHALELEPQDKLNLSCPSTARTPADRKTSRLPVNLLSVSPWAYRISYHPTRYPRYIPEAYCLCKGCLLGPYGAESDRYRSTPVYAPSVILKRTGSCVGGRHSYTEVYVSVAVGCTCVPLLQKERDGHSSNQSLERAGPKAGQLLRPGRRKRQKVKLVKAEAAADGTSSLWRFLFTSVHQCFLSRRRHLSVKG